MTTIITALITAGIPACVTLWTTANCGGGYLDAQLPKLPSITCNSAGAHAHSISYGSSDVYDTSFNNTVRPTSYAVMMWKRTA